MKNFNTHLSAAGPMSNSLSVAEQEWRKLLAREDSEYFFPRSLQKINWDEEIITLNTDQCTYLFMEFAEHAGLDLERFGRQLHADGKPGRFMVAIAFRTVLEVEGFYIERPYASSLHHVPRAVLVSLGAAILGIATAKTAAISPEIGGTISGIGSLLINILSARALDDKPKPYDFYGELILELLDPVQPVSVTILQQQTRFHEAVLRKIIEELEKKNAVRRIFMGSDVGIIRNC
jgi:hypothetical protein